MGAGDPWLLVQHMAFEGPGSIALAVADSGADLTIVRVDLGDAIPPPAAVADVAGLVVMGGPMSAPFCAPRSRPADPSSGCASGPSSWPPHSGRP